MQKENQTLDKSSKITIIVFIVAFCALVSAMSVDINKNRETMIKNAKIAQQKADSISKNTKAINFFQKTK